MNALIAEGRRLFDEAQLPCIHPNMTVAAQVALKMRRELAFRRWAERNAEQLLLIAEDHHVRELEGH